MDTYLACRLPARDGGLGLSNYIPTRAARYAASYIAARPVITNVSPDVAALSLTLPTAPSTVGFAAAYAGLQTTFLALLTNFARLDNDQRHWVDGSTVTAYHPRIARDFQLPDIPELFDGASSNIRTGLSQAKLAAVVNASEWLELKKDLDAFDVDNASRPGWSCLVPHREATRLVSCSQTGAGAYLVRLPDLSLKGSVVASIDFVTICQRRLGLYLSILADLLDHRERRGGNVTQHDRLGDAALNAANATHRHNEGLHAMYTALRSAAPANCPIRLGDKGDGTPASKEEARRRQAHLNDGHIPDIYRPGPPHILYEWKCYTPFGLSRALGHGSQRGGGAASTADGGDFAFGNTLEALVAMVLGLKGFGAPGARALNRRTGEGRVDAHAGDYADAIAKGHLVHLLATESTGALSRGVTSLLSMLAKSVRGPDGHDSTAYGTGRASPKSFYMHHLAAISSAIVRADALTLRNAAASLAFTLAHSLV